MSENNKMQRKKFAADCIKTGAFLLVFVILLVMFSTTIFSKKSASLYENLFTETYAYENEPENTIQVMGLGNSDLYSAFVPNVLWQEFGYASVISGAPFDSPSRALTRLNEMLRLQNPSVVLIEVDMLFGDKTDDSGVSLKNRTEDVLDTLADGGFEDNISNMLPVFLFHDKWKSVGVETEEKPVTHGYVFSVDIKDFEFYSNYMEDLGEEEEISEANLKSLDNIIKLCLDDDILPVLVEMPSLDSWNYARSQAVTDYAEENDLLFIDMNVEAEAAGIDFETDFRDSGKHLNYSGASKVTRHIGNIISELDVPLGLTDMREDENYSSWNHNAEAFLAYHSRDIEALNARIEEILEARKAEEDEKNKEIKSLAPENEKPGG